MKALKINMRLTEQAAKNLPEEVQLNLQSYAMTQQPILPGDKIRFDSIPECPWLVVKDRYWTIGESTSLTIVLDAPDQSS